MKLPAISKSLVPVNEFRANLADCISRLDENGRPIVITQRGRAAALLLHPGVLDQLEDEKELVQKVLRGLKEHAAGNVVDDKDVWEDIDAILDDGREHDGDEVDSRRAG
jgi:prevent-host-death family protein